MSGVVAVRTRVDCVAVRDFVAERVVVVPVRDAGMAVRDVVVRSMARGVRG